jgi:predicted N-acetyltransferase YhbS
MPIADIDDIVPLSIANAAEIEALLDDAFGADRKSRTAYLLRMGKQPVAALSFAIFCDGKLSATIQCWRVLLVPTSGMPAPLILVGPVAVASNMQNKGLGSRLMKHMIVAAAKQGDPAMVMIGDPEYYERFGFYSGGTSGWTLPGPWEPRRLLSRNMARHDLPENGELGPDHAL